ncbi:MAG: hypothetical protein WEC36_15785 [Phycisphaeraceae bacterium]
MTAAHALIIDAARCGVLLYVEGDALRFKALASMPAELAARLKAHRADVLALLTATDAPAMPRPTDEPATARASQRPRQAETTPPFPTPQDWIAGRSITPESVGFERYQFGGCPHVLRHDLRRRWLATYSGELAQGRDEGTAWAEAWRAAQGTTEGATGVRGNQAATIST